MTNANIESFYVSRDASKRIFKHEEEDTGEVNRKLKFFI